MDKYKDSLDNYIRVGTDYYRISDIPLKNDSYKGLLHWNAATIRMDFRENKKDPDPVFLVKKYLGFCFVPGHGRDYSREIDGFYNQYEKLTWEPTPGVCDYSLEFMKHIFGEQYELGLDYLALLYLKPDHILPILCLVSSERSTGKSTFVKWMKRIFQGNMTINSNEEFRARFNSDWITKLIIAVEETLLEKKEDSERIKALSTGDRAKNEGKNKDKYETPFYGKFILASNNETKFINIDQEETRYWVRKIPVPEIEKTDLLDKLIEEIPAFLNFIIERGILSSKKSRMWFSADDIHTDALDRLKKGNRPSAFKELITMILDQMDEYEKDEIKMTLSDVKEHLKHLRIGKDYIKEILQNHLGLRPTKNSSTYKTYSYINNNDGSCKLWETDKKGRYYTFIRKDIEKLNLYDSNISDDKKNTNLKVVKSNFS